MNILFIVKVEILVDIKWLYKPPPLQLCSLLRLEWLTYFEHVTRVFLFFNHLTTYHSIIAVRLEKGDHENDLAYLSSQVS